MIYSIRDDGPVVLVTALGHRPDTTGEALRRTRPKAEADERNRTADPFITSEVLYQLSYVGT